MKTNFKLLALLAIVSFTACESSEEAISVSENTTVATVAVKTKNNPATFAKTSTVTTEAALKTAVASALPGDIIKISGTINLTSTLQLTKNGTSSAKINLTGGVLNCSALPSGQRGMLVLGSYWNITNMTVKNAPDNGIVFQQGGYNYVYNVITSNNGDTGLQIYDGSHDNYIQSCKSNDNYDVANGGENADGYACKLSGGKNNTFDGCIANHNSDDGWDLFGQPYTVVIKNCTASNNGYGTAGDGNGFKLGSAGQNIPHTATNDTATNNKGVGYDGNGNVGHITITGSGGSGNQLGLFYRIY